MSDTKDGSRSALVVAAMWPSRGVEHGLRVGQAHVFSSITGGWLAPRREGLELTHVRAAVVAPGPVRMVECRRVRDARGPEGENSPP